MSFYSYKELVSTDNLDDLNTENITFINDIWIVKEPSQIFFETTIFLPIVLFGIIGNLLILYLLVKNPPIRTPTNLLIGNMALADLLSLILHPWIILIYDFFQNYQLGAFGCKIEGTIECSILLASVISLTAISYDRLTAIVLPIETRLSRNGVKIVIGFTWVIGILISVPLSIYRSYKERQWKNFLEKYCKEQTQIINVYWYVIVTVLVWLPLTIQLICYIFIFLKLRKYEKIVLRKFDHRQVNYKKKVVRMMLAVILTFMICRLPFTGLIFYRHQLLKNNDMAQTNDVRNQVNGTYHTLWFVSKYLIYVNAALNPIIYGLTNEKIRRCLKMLKPFKPRATTPKSAIKNTTIKQQMSPAKKCNIFWIRRTKPKSVAFQSDNTVILQESKFDVKLNKI